MIKILILLVIDIYSYIFSNIIGNCCRFTPSCSIYAKDAIKKFGVIIGSFIIAKRIVKCNPWCVGGYDPVP